MFQEKYICLQSIADFTISVIFKAMQNSPNITLKLNDEQQSNRQTLFRSTSCLCRKIQEDKEKCCRRVYLKKHWRHK